MINLGTLSLGELGDSGKREEPGQAARGPRRARPRAVAGPALAALIEETVAVSSRLQAAIEELHGGEGPSSGRRALLRDLSRWGPQTVPQLARRRSVSRQRVQALVNPLAEAGYVELLANPAHRRSWLVGLTGRGRELVSRLERREGELLAAIEVADPGEDLRRAAAVLRSLRESLESLKG